MSPEGIVIIIAASANAATIILSIGAVNQKLTDVRDDMREIRASLQSCLQILLVARSIPPPPPPPWASDPP